MSEEANQAQRRQWNDAVRLSAWRQREPLTAAVTATLLEHVALRGGETVLDIGTGGGRTAIAAARQVGPDGEAVGADISGPLVDLARQRAADEGVTNVRFMVADVQTAALEKGPLRRRHEPVRGHVLRRNGHRLRQRQGAHAAGRSVNLRLLAEPGRQPLVFGNDATAVLPPVPPPGPGKNATGPFTLGNPEYTGTLLAAAGWSAVEQTPYRQTVTLAPEVLVDDDDYLRFLGVAGNQLAEARAALEGHLAPLRRHDGRYDAPLAFQVFTARN